MDVGKSFETDFESSFEDSEDIYIKRYRDVIGYVGSVSISDYAVYKYPNIFLVELKTSAGISISISEKYKTYSKTKDGHKKGEYVLDENGNKIITHYGRLNADQLNMMLKESKKKGVFAGYLMEFRKAKKCFYISAQKVLEYINNPDRARKSIPVSFLDSNGLLVPRDIKSSVWTCYEQELLLENKDLTANECYDNVRDKIDRTRGSIKSKFYQVRKDGIKKPTQYIHYEYDKELFNMIKGDD